uniref:Leucine-rich repeats and calponin homology (CH) domain containing 4 n=1 Tax=Poecilia formosa TaxID=48698 RepID=A0A096LWZ3_POEFO
MAAGDGAQLPATVAASRSVEKALEEAAASGALNLSNRKLKEFPRSARNYDLSDITHADLSKNRLCELPEELCQFISLETLSLYHNGMRLLSPSLANLQALTYLNLSRNLLSSLPPSVFQLPLLRVLIVSNNKLPSLPSSIYSLTHLRQLDVSCNELQSLPAELGQLETLRDLNLRRNQLTTLPEEISELPLVRLDVSCNRISHVPLCFRHLRHLQTISLDSNPLQMPPAQICSKGKYHIFKYLNMEACKSHEEELEKHLNMRPTGFKSSLSDQELFTGQFGGLDSGFNSVDSGSKRWSGNESTDDFSERSLQMAEVNQKQRHLEEQYEEDVNGAAEQVSFISSSVTEEIRDSRLPEQDCPKSSPSTGGNCSSLSPEPPSSPTLEERRRPGTLFIWQERERLQQQREKASLLKSSAKPGSHVASAPQTGSSSCGGSPENGSAHSGLRQRCAVSPIPLVKDPLATEKPGLNPTSSPPGQAQKPNSFLFRTSSRSNVKPTGSESRTTLRSPKEERKDLTQLRKTLESRLKTSLPEDLSEALSNGTVLCQLVNQIRPRSVSIIHIPSPAVPKLSSAKSRLNVENFITACRKLGVPEDVLLCKLPSVLRCVTALLAVEEECPTHHWAPASSTSSSSSSLLSPDFLLFYCCVMALLYAAYCCLLT